VGYAWALPNVRVARPAIAFPPVEHEEESMAANPRLEELASLLEIRKKGYRRSAAITGGLFALGAVAVLLSGLVGEGGKRSLILEALIVAALGIGWGATWVRLEVARGLSQMVTALRE
jgi:hypothetical protein